MIDRCRTPILTLALLACLAPTTLEAQFRRGRADRTAPAAWAPISVGLHGGYDESSRGEIIGAHAQIPILRSGKVELVPSYDLTFLNGAKDHQYALEAIYVTGGRAGGLIVGAGLGLRDSVIDSTPADPRSNIFGYTIVAGFKSGSTGPIVTKIQLRWIFLQDTNANFRPVPLTLGIGIPLWGRSPAS